MLRQKRPLIGEVIDLHPDRLARAMTREGLDANEDRVGQRFGRRLYWPLATTRKQNPSLQGHLCHETAPGDAACANEAATAVVAPEGGHAPFDR